MTDKPRLVRVLMTILLGSVIWISLVGFSGSVRAVTVDTSDDFEVFIGRPAKGESFYSGPSSLLYSIPISGWVIGYGDAPQEILIRLEILKNDVVVEQGESHLRSDGTYLFYANVNPGNSEPLFSPEQGSCAATCHVLASMNLPGGDLVTRVTAIKPGGASATKEVAFTIDYSRYTRIPVEVIAAEESGLPMEDIQIVASTRLYLWRGRTFLGQTDADGNAFVRVETLSEAPTTYLVEVEPVVVDGVLYQGVSREEIVIGADVDQADPVMLYVRSSMGNISGQIALPQGSGAIFPEIEMISLSDGSSRDVTVLLEGGFQLAALPIDRYLFVLDAELLDENRLAAKPVEVDLFSMQDVDLTIPAESLGEEQVSVAVLAEDGSWLPFVWIQGDEGDGFQMKDPGGEKVFLPGSSIVEAITASAPGYYSKQVDAEAEDGDIAGFEVQLTPKPDLQNFTWGEGDLAAPAESLMDMQNDLIYLDYGWLWGENGGTHPLKVRASGAEIEIDSGQFALEVLPNERVWFYLFEGEAVVTDLESGKSQVLRADEMINLDGEGGLYPLDYNPVIPAFLDPIETLPLEIVWKPTIWSKIQQFLGNLSVGIAQIITIVTYSMVLLSLFGIPIYMIIRKWRQR